MVIEAGENPYPVELLTTEQIPIYEEWQRLFEIANNLPPDDTEIGTIIIPTGDWLDRIPLSLSLFKNRFYNQNKHPKLVISGATSHPDMPGGGARADKITRAIRTYGQLTKAMKNEIVTDMRSVGTKEQAENIYSLMKHGGIEEPWVVVVSAYHLPRLISTFVKTILTKEDIPITHLYSVPVELPWRESISHEPRGERWKQIFSEIERIHTYREKGDVATEQEVLEYNKWLNS